MNKNLSYSEICQALIDAQSNIMDLMDQEKVSIAAQEHMNNIFWELQKAIELTFKSWKQEYRNKDFKED